MLYIIIYIYYNYKEYTNDAIETSILAPLAPLAPPAPPLHPSPHPLLCPGRRTLGFQGDSGERKSAGKPSA